MLAVRVRSAFAAWLLVAAALPAADWSQITLSGGITPLENRVAALNHGAYDPDLLVFTLWTTGVNMNHLGAFIVPAPYDGSGVTFTADIDVGPLFAVGDICAIGVDRAVVPYVKFSAGSFSVFVAELANGSWSTSVIADSVADEYHSSDCFISEDGIFIMALNDSGASYDFFQSDFPNPLVQGPPPLIFDIYDDLDASELGGAPVSPLDGGPIPFAEPQSSMFLEGSFTNEMLLGLGSDADLDGYLLIGESRTNDIDGAYLPRNYDTGVGEADSDLPIYRSFQGGGLGDVAWAVAQRSGVLELERVGLDTPADDATVPLGPITPGSLFGFQGVDVALGPDGMVYVVADNSYQIDPVTLAVTEVTGYPFLDLGGPANLEFLPGFEFGVAVGPGSQVLAFLDIGRIFGDDFETGDTAAWSTTVD